MPTDIPILLTFDDGPGAGNQAPRTAAILDALIPVPPLAAIKVVFFIQTHSGRMGADDDAVHRGNKLVKRMHDDGHLVAIHTGSTKDHEAHTKRLAGLNAAGLVNDLTRAKQRIQAITGSPAQYVRAPYFNIGPKNSAIRTAVLGAYDSVGLKHIGANVQPKDGETVEEVRKDPTVNRLPKAERHQEIKRRVSDKLRTYSHSSIKRGDGHLVVLFHDPDPITYELGLLPHYIDVIRNAVMTAPGPGAPYVPRFASNQAEMEAILQVAKVEY